MINMKKVSGFTLIELMIALAVVAIALAFGVPSFRSLIQNTRATSKANEFITSVNQARSEALKRQAIVSVVAAAGGSASNEFGNGWAVVVDANGNGVLDSGEVSVSRTTANPNGATLDLTDNVSFLTFQRDGTLGAVRTFQLRISGCRGNAGRNISISRVGHVTVTPVAC